MASLDRPQLRPLSGRRVVHQGRPFVALEDPTRLFEGQVLVPLDLFQRVIRHFDGRSTLTKIGSKALAEGGPPIDPAELRTLVDRLDRALVLEGPSASAAVDAYARIEVRPPSLAGRSYLADPDALRAELDRYFTGPGGSGLPSPGSTSILNPTRAVLSPHIDFGRGGPVYSHAYRRLVERSDADLFVILGVAHQPCRNRFALTRKHFATPLGTATTDRAFVDLLAREAGPHLFEDELAHRTEHSIEFQVVWLQHVLAGRRDFAIVPILVGSFHDLMREGVEPADDSEVGAMIRALKSAEAASGRKVAYVGGIDLCHVGPDFGDPAPVDPPTLEDVGAFDRAMLGRAEALDASGWFAGAAEVDDRWRVCGLAATYTLLHAIGPARGEVLSYDQAVNPSRSCCVTFASVAYASGSDLDGD